MTSRLPAGSRAARVRARSRNRRRTRLRTTAPPTPRPTTNPTLAPPLAAWPPPAGSAVVGASTWLAVRLPVWSPSEPAGASAGSFAPISRCTTSSGPPPRWPRRTVRVKSARRVSRAAAGNTAPPQPGDRGRTRWPAAMGQPSQHAAIGGPAASGAEAGTALAPARRENRTSGPGAHAQPEPVCLRPAAVVRLKSTLAHCGSRCGAAGLVTASRRSGAPRRAVHFTAVQRARQRAPDPGAVLVPYAAPGCRSNRRPRLPARRWSACARWHRARRTSCSDYPVRAHGLPPTTRRPTTRLPRPASHALPPTPCLPRPAPHAPGTQSPGHGSGCRARRSPGHRSGCRARRAAATTTGVQQPQTSAPRTSVSRTGHGFGP
jgi:hypothetical protein